MFDFILAILVFFPFFAGLICYIVGRGHETLRDILAILAAVLEFVVMLVLLLNQVSFESMQPFLTNYVPQICGFGLWFELDGFRAVYGLVAALMWMMTIMLSREYFTHHGNRNRFYFFMLWTLGATMGVFLSSSLFTTFVFFEIMSFTSYVWVAQEENVPSLKAADTYLVVAIMGGLVMLMGLFLLYHELGTLVIAEIPWALSSHGMSPVIYVSGACMLFGFGAKAGAFPLHIWLPKAHPVAPAPASALLSGILTKTGIYGILLISTRLFLHDTAWGTTLLILGELTMFGGALLAVCSIDLKRTLACSSMSQIGFILIGIGMQGLLGEENVLAVNGTMLHMVNHSLIKLLLFMAAGVIFMNTHSLDLNEIRGFGRKKPLLMVLFLLGALAIAGIPGFSGYVSKTLLHESIVEYGGGLAMKLAEWVFLLSGGMTLAYMTKLFVCIFVEENTDKTVQKRYDDRTTYMNGLSSFALVGSGILLFIWGILPHKTMDKVAELAQWFMRFYEEGELVHYFSLKNLSGGLISIGIGIVIYLVIIRRFLIRREVYRNVWPSWLDLEELLYRPLLMTILPVICGVVFRFFDTFPDMLILLMRRTLFKETPLPYEREEGSLWTQFLGGLANRLQTLANHTWRRHSRTQTDYIHQMAVREEERQENFRIIQRSLSFGLMLFGLGLMLTLIYLVFL